MVCPNCGGQLNGGESVCGNCGTPLSWGTPPQQQNTQYQNTQYQGGGSCDFDGTGVQFLGIWIVNILILTFTLGICYPWVVCRNLKWRKHHTLINGRRLAFNGSAIGLFGNWIKWWLLSVITCGIYLFWVAVRMNEWEAAHTCYEDNGMIFDNCFYDGGVGERLGTSIIAYLITTFTCGIGRPWGDVMLLKYDSEHTVINGDRLAFSGTGGSFFVQNLIITLLTIITLGIYTPWGVCKINKWVYSNTSVASRGNVNAKR